MAFDKLPKGLRDDAFEDLTIRQAGRCAICGIHRDGEDYAGRYEVKMCVDHDHRTGRVRGMLCGACNTGLGDAWDLAEFVGLANAHWKAERIGRALAYLVEHGAPAATAEEILRWRKKASELARGRRDFESLSISPEVERQVRENQRASRLALSGLSEWRSIHE